MEVDVTQHSHTTTQSFKDISNTDAVDTSESINKDAVTHIAETCQRDDANGPGAEKDVIAPVGSLASSVPDMPY
eukprot:3312025-Rhodomonas_salina.3